MSMSDPSGASNANGRPHESDIVLWSQRLSETVRPLGYVELEVLFNCFCQSPAFLAAARQVLREHYFDPGAEIQYLLVYRALCSLTDRFGAPNCDTLTAETVRLIQGEISPMTSDLVESITRQDGQGLIWNACHTEVPESTLAFGRDVLRRYLHERTVVLPLRRMLSHGTQGCYATDIPEFLAAAVEQHEQVESLAQPESRLQTFGELRRRGQAGELVRRQVVQGVLPERVPALLSGPTGIGKTLLTTNLFAAMAMGVPWLEYDSRDGRRGFDVLEPQRVGLYTLESGEDILWQNLENMLRRYQHLYPDRAAELESRLRENLLVNPTWLPDLGDRGNIRRWARTIRQERLTQVAVDPLYCALGRLAKLIHRDGEVYPELRYVAQQVEEAGAGVLLVHHTAIDRQNRQTYRDMPDHEKSAYPVFFRVARVSIAVKTAAAYDDETRTSSLLVGIRGKGRVTGGTFRVALREGASYEAWSAAAEPYRPSEAAAQARSDELQAIDHSIVARVAAFAGGVTFRDLWRGCAKIPGLGVDRLRPALERLTAEQSGRLWLHGERYFARAGGAGNGALPPADTTERRGAG